MSILCLVCLSIFVVIYLLGVLILFEFARIDSKSVPVPSRVWIRSIIWPIVLTLHLLGAE